MTPKINGIKTLDRSRHQDCSNRINGYLNMESHNGQPHEQAIRPNLANGAVKSEKIKSN
jgi:hypothetical protein